PTTAGKHPKDHFDFFPLTVDVEERQYAAGKIPGSFFRREGRPSSEAILACRLIDRPLRPLFVKGLRNEVQVVETVLAIHPDDAYAVLAMNGASMSTKLSGLPFSGPVGATRIALVAGQRTAWPRDSERGRAGFAMAGGGRGSPGVDGGQATTEEVVAQGLEECKKFIRVLDEAQRELAGQTAKDVQEFPLFPDYADDAYAAVEAEVTDSLSAALSIAGKAERESRMDEI